MKFPSDAQLYGILDLGYVDAGSALEVADEMLDGGVQILQLRAKGRSTGEILSVANGLAVICRKFGVPLILNDHPELVEEAGADGVHVGQDDVSVAEARRLAGGGAIVGLSTHSLAQAAAAMESRPDYIGFGPLFATPTKPDYAAIGTGDIREVHRRVSLPVFCIGGIKRENLNVVIGAGAQRVVIVSGILQALDRAAYVRDCREILGRGESV